MTDKLRFGVIGAGGFAEICHVPGLQSHPQAEVVALCGRRREHAAAMAGRLGVPDVHTDYRELLARTDIDAVTIVTPNVNHAEIAIAALQAGKHVFCEKPLGMDGPQVKGMLQAAEASGRVHMVSFTFRYLYGLQKLREMVRAGAIGRPHYVRVRGESLGGLDPTLKAGWRDVQALSGGGMIQDMASHYVDLVNYVLEPIAEVCGVLQNLPRTRPNGVTGEPTLIDADDLNGAFFRTEGGLPGDYWLSRITTSHGDWGLEVVGEEGALQCSLTRGDRDELSLLRPGRGQEWQPIPLPAEASIHQPTALGRMMRAFVDAILRGAPDGVIDATFADGYRVQCTLDAVARSVAEKRWLSVQL